MVNDRVLFGDRMLAFVKAAVCLLAFLTAVFFIKETKMYLFGVVTYSCGCICDYIEVTRMESKSRRVRYFAFGLSVLLGACIITAFSMAMLYDMNQDIEKFVIGNNKWINCVLALFFAIPLANGSWLLIKGIQKEEENKQKESNKRSVSAFDVKP